MACLAWFIQQNIKINAEDAFISPHSLELFNETMDDISSRKIKAVEGSKIVISVRSGSEDFTGVAVAKAKKVGFNAVFCP